MKHRTCVPFASFASFASFVSSASFGATATAIFLLAGCGGGGSSGDSGTSAPVASSQAPASGSSNAPVLTTSGAPVTTGSTCSIPDFAATALARINQLRAAGADCHSDGVFAPTTALTWSALLTQSAEVQSQDMVANNFFSHTGSNGSTLSTRVTATGYNWSRLGENIAAGYATIDLVMAGWTASDGHCANLMNPNFTQVGLVCVPGTTADTYPNYWTMDLATPSP